MGERYWITGVQLGMLQELPEKELRSKLVEKIIDKQFIGNTNTLKKILKGVK